MNILVDHPSYHLITCEDASALIDQIKSPNVKLLFDIYHQQITEGNLIRNITENIDKIGHFHAAGHPGRTELNQGEIITAMCLRPFGNWGTTASGAGIHDSRGSGAGTCKDKGRNSCGLRMQGRKDRLSGLFFLWIFSTG